MVDETKYKKAAELVINCASEMSDTGRLEIATWLRQQAAELEKEGFRFAPRHTARYLYADRAPDLP